MIKKKRKRKCKHCKDFFVPDYRNAGRQKFCGKPECRKASKTESQRKWLQKPKNIDYFKGLSTVVKNFTIFGRENFTTFSRPTPLSER